MAVGFLHVPHRLLACLMLAVNNMSLCTAYMLVALLMYFMHATCVTITNDLQLLGVVNLPVAVVLSCIQNSRAVSGLCDCLWASVCSICQAAIHLNFWHAGASAAQCVSSRVCSAYLPIMRAHHTAAEQRLRVPGEGMHLHACSQYDITCTIGSFGILRESKREETGYISWEQIQKSEYALACLQSR